MVGLVGTLWGWLSVVSVEDLSLRRRWRAGWTASTAEG